MWGDGGEERETEREREGERERERGRERGRESEIERGRGVCYRAIMYPRKETFQLIIRCEYRNQSLEIDFICREIKKISRQTLPFGQKR